MAVQRNGIHDMRYYTTIIERGTRQVLYSRHLPEAPLENHRIRLCGPTGSSKNYVIHSITWLLGLQYDGQEPQLEIEVD